MKQIQHLPTCSGIKVQSSKNTSEIQVPKCCTQVQYLITCRPKLNFINDLYTGAAIYKGNKVSG